MGLLDNNPMGLMDPRTMGLLTASAGLLQAGGPSRTPVGTGQALGQGLMSGMQGYGQAVTQQRNEVMTALQMEKLKRELMQQDQLRKLFGGAQQPQEQNASSGPTESGMSPSTSVGAFGTPDFATVPQLPAPQAPQGSRGPSLEQLGGLAATGYKIDDLLKLYELQNPKAEVHGGYAYNPRAIQPGTFLPQVQITPQGQGVGVTPNPAGGLPSISALPGSLSTYGAFTGAAEDEKASREPFLGVTDYQGRQIPMTRKQFVDTYAPRPPTGGGGEGRAPQSDIVNFAPTEADALQQVLAAQKAGKTAYVTVDPAKAGGMGQTPGQKVTQTTIAEGDSKRVLDLEAKIPNMLSVSRRLDRMAALTADDRTYAAAGAEMKSTLGSIAQAFGLKVNEQKTANTEEYLAHVAELLKDRLASKDFGSGSGVSNLDILAAQKPLPDLAKTAAGRLQLIKALKSDAERNLQDAQAARDYFDQNQTLRGFRYPSEVAAETQPPLPIPKTPGSPPSSSKILKYNPTTKRIE